MDVRLRSLGNKLPVFDWLFRLSSNSSRETLFSSISSWTLSIDQRLLWVESDSSPKEEEIGLSRIEMGDDKSPSSDSKW